MAAGLKLAQIWMVSVVAAAIFFGSGLLLVSPELLAAWTRGGSREGTLLWMTIPRQSLSVDHRAQDGTLPQNGAALPAVV